jgi:hypothetical protein
MYDDMALAGVLDVQVKLATEDEMGQVKGGFLKLRGHLFKVHCRGDEYDENISVDCHETSMTVYDDDDHNKIVHRRSKRLWCLPLTYSGSLDCLLLAKVRHEHNTFRRIGIVKYYDPTEDPDKDFKNPFLQLVKDAEKMVNPFYRLMKAGGNFLKVKRGSSSLTEFTII